LLGYENRENFISNSIEDLKSLAGKACIELYLSLHVSEMRDKSEQIKTAWSIGQEIYFNAEKILCKHDWVNADNKVVKGGLICQKCHTVKAT
jgi:hypothetical protein